MHLRSIHPIVQLRTCRALLPALLLAASAGAAPSPAPAPSASVDATCPWGRLSDGKGKLLRCLSRDEALRLREASAPPPAASSPGTADGPTAPPAAPPAAPPEPAVPPAAPVEPPREAPATESALLADVGPVVADEGALPDALRSLKKPAERYVECVDKNGGLSSERGEVELRFLVQGRGRAEGVSVKKRHGVSDVAAKCIADVVDRRYVGYPEAPAVGATVVVTVTKKKR